MYSAHTCVAYTDRAQSLLGGQRPRSSGRSFRELPAGQCGWSSHLRATGIRRDRLLGRKRPWSNGCASREVRFGSRGGPTRARLGRQGRSGAGAITRTVRRTSSSGRFSSVSAGRAHTCALRASGEIVCGEQKSHLTQEMIDARRPPVDPDLAIAPPGRFLSVSAGEYHTCAVGESGEVVCWGWAGGAHSRRLLPPQGKYQSRERRRRPRLRRARVEASGRLLGRDRLQFLAQHDFSRASVQVNQCSLSDDEACAARGTRRERLLRLGRMVPNMSVELEELDPFLSPESPAAYLRHCGPGYHRLPGGGQSVRN